jgi:SagB-type dehydrogenase family enzyme
MKESIICLLLLGCLSATGIKVWAQDEALVELPPASTFGEMSLEQALNRRRSVRQFKDTALSESDLSQLLWSAQGISDVERGLRTAPSAGAIYPLTAYAVTPDGIYRYLPELQSLRLIESGDFRMEMARAAFNQIWIRRAGLVIVLAAEDTAMRRRYGENAERFVDLEAGHAAQNVLLTAVSRDLGAVPVGAFDAKVLAEVLALDGDVRPVYMVVVGQVP